MNTRKLLAAGAIGVVTLGGYVLSELPASHSHSSVFGDPATGIDLNRLAASLPPLPVLPTEAPKPAPKPGPTVQLPPTTGEDDPDDDPNQDPGCEEDEACWNPQTMGNGHSGPTPAAITIQDDSSNWPTERAVAAWQLPAGTVRFGRCATFAHCIHIVDVEQLPALSAGHVTLGLTVWREPGTATVRLSNETPGSLALTVETHELGHAFGLQHDTSGIMNPDAHADAPRPTAAELGRAARNLTRS